MLRNKCDLTPLVQQLVQGVQDTFNFMHRLQGGGLKAAFIQKMFRDSTSVEVLVRMLLIISQLARMAKVSGRNTAPASSMANNYELIHKSDFYSTLKKLFNHKDSSVRMRVCNLIGTFLNH
jgi:hypothetical protein